MSSREPSPRAAHAEPQQAVAEIPAADLARAIADAARGSDSAPLRKLVCDYVRALKAAGLPPEAVVVRVKETLRPQLWWGAPRQGWLTPQEITERAVEWCIGEYYRAD